MRIITSTGGVVMPMQPRQGIRDLKNAGFENIMLDLGMFCQIESLWPGTRKLPEDALRNPETIRAGYQALLQTCEELGVSLPVGYLMSLGGGTERKDLDDKVRKLAIDGVRACEEAGCCYVIAPSLFAGVERGQEWMVNREFYLELAAACEKKETQLLLMNECKNVNGHMIRGNCAEVEEALTWMEELNAAVGMERFGFCMSVGAYNVCGQDMREVAVALGAHLKAVLLGDCYGHLPFVCNNSDTDWLGLIRGLRDAAFDGELILCHGGTTGGFSPLLKPNVLALAKSVADYFVWQINLESAMKRYDSIVLFGAGNMCRNYMKNYGEKYPPLFTCDNSSARWGETFCGLEVRPPEVLRDLPDGCGVFICNIYYREIEKQLREMGVKNIEYFNDEYMPSFFMDRLEMR